MVTYLKTRTAREASDYMKHLVVYFSRTGNNRTIGYAIAQALNADVDEIIDKKNRKGMLNWLRAGRDSMGGKLTEVEFEKDPQDYEIVKLEPQFGQVIPYHLSAPTYSQLI